MTQPCPTCGKPVDPIRAPAVGVRAGKIVSFCSKACAGSATPAKPAAPERRDATPIPKRDATPVPKKAKTRTPAPGVATPSSLLDSGPVIEIIHEPASGVVTSAADARSGPASAPASRSETSGAIQIADTGHIDDYVSPDDDVLHRGRGWLVVAILVVLGGGAFAAYQLGYLDSLFDRDSHAAVRPQSAPPPLAEAAPHPEPAPSIAPPAAVDRARTVLHAALASGTPRIQELAAAALARTGASEAVVALIASLPKQPNDAAKIETYYALARGADKRGTDGLIASLSLQRRDDRLAAARRLAMLGDKRAAAPLAQSLELPAERLSAAASLAYLADPRAIEVLEAILADAKSSVDARASAVVALGIAGKRDVAPALRDLLRDASWKTPAAAALAELHDPAAKPVLVHQLDMPTLRVAAARGLRRLDPELDVRPLLPGLVAATQRPQAAVAAEAAEALLILAGPPAWSDYP